MAEDRERDSTEQSMPSGDPGHPENDRHREYGPAAGSRADDIEDFEAEDGPERSDLASDDPDAGDVPGSESPYEEEPAEDAAAGGRSDADLVGVGAARRRSRAEVEPRTGTAAVRPKKTKPTPRQHAAPERPRRTGPVRFVKESVGELQKVVYPTGQQLVQYFVVVLIFVLFIIAIVSLLDLAFGWAIFRIFS